MENPGHDIKCTLPEFAGGKHFMRCIAVKKKSLKEERQKPVAKKKYKNYHKLKFNNDYEFIVDAFAVRLLNAKIGLLVYLKFLFQINDFESII
ncbi:MAG TPA: hypothetical protein VF610_02810 [Segetibacter sp.]